MQVSVLTTSRDLPAHTVVGCISLDKHGQLGLPLSTAQVKQWTNATLFNKSIAAENRASRAMCGPWTTFVRQDARSDVAQVY